MRTIEEFEVSGTIDDELVAGKVTGFMATMKSLIPKGLKMTKLKTLELYKIVRTKTMEMMESIKEEISGTMKNITIDPVLVKKIAAGALIVAMSTTFTGCKIIPEARTTTIEQSYEEQTVEIDYFIMAGDTLESIVKRYKDGDVRNEIYNICVQNNIQNSNQIQSGTFIKLNVPLSKLEDFDYTYTQSEVQEWEAMEHFIVSAFNPENVHPDNVMFWRDRQEVLGDSNLSPHEIANYESQTPIIYKATNAREDLNQMKNIQVGFYSEEDIKNKEQEMNSYYAHAVKLTEESTGKKYGEDYMLLPEVKAIPIEKSFNK